MAETTKSPKNCMRIEACRYGETSELEYLVYKDSKDTHPIWTSVSKLKDAKQALVDFMKMDEKNKRQKRSATKALTKEGSDAKRPRSNSGPVKRKPGRPSLNPKLARCNSTTAAELPTKSVMKNKPQMRHVRSSSTGTNVSKPKLGRRSSLGAKKESAAKAFGLPKTINMKTTGAKTHVRSNTTGAVKVIAGSPKMTGVTDVKPKARAKMKSKSFSPVAMELALAPMNARMGGTGKQKQLPLKNVFKGNKTVVNNNNKGEPLRRRRPSITNLNMKVTDSHMLMITSTENTTASPQKRVLCSVPLTSKSIPLHKIILRPDMLATAGTSTIDGAKVKKIQSLVKRAKKQQVAKQLSSLKRLNKASKPRKVLPKPLPISLNKRLKLDVDSHSETESTDSGEIFFKNHSGQPGHADPPHVVPALPTPPGYYSEPMSYKTPPSSPHSESPTHEPQFDSCDSHPASHQPQVPAIYQLAQVPKMSEFASPSNLAYQKLLSVPDHSKVKRKNAPEVPIERRVSVRTSESAFKYKEILVRKCTGYTQIILSSGTQTKHGLNPQAFRELNQVLHNAKYDDSRVVMLTGTGNVFCTGIDLQYLKTGDRRQTARTLAEALRDFISNMISFPKPIIAAVNGSAIGLGMTLLSLCDIVYASDKALFYCPYAKLGQTPEGCASYTFPLSLGGAMANEILLAGRRITAIEANNLGFVSQVFWPTALMQEVTPRVQNMALQSATALEATKLMIRSHNRSKLDITNNSECQMLIDRWSSNECHLHIEQHLQQQADWLL